MDITPHPSDVSRTGQVLAASLRLSGRLKKITSPLRDFSHGTLFEGSYLICDGENELGHLHPDAPLAEEDQYDIYLLPILKMTIPDLSYRNPDPDKHPYKQALCGLVLSVHSSEDGDVVYYKRVGLFGFRCQKPDFRAMGWFDDVQEQKILLR